MTKRILAIDPGNTCSALVTLLVDDDDTLTVGNTFYGDNRSIREVLLGLADDHDRLVIEKIESFGMAVGASVFETVFESGRFAELWEAISGSPAERMPRRDVKLFLCNSSKAKDANVRQAVMDRFGSDKATAIGTKKNPGPLYGVSGDKWAALAVAITFAATLPKVPAFRKAARRA